MAPEDALLQDTGSTQQAAIGGRAGIGTLTYADLAERLLDNGFEPLPVWPRSKRAAPDAWTTGIIDTARVASWNARFGHCGVGLRTGHLVGLDIDVMDPEAAHAIQALAVERFGSTLMRVGRWPKRLLLYRTGAPFSKMKVPGIEVLGDGQQFVAFGIHPDTKQPYGWPLGETPLDVTLTDLPLVDRDSVAAWVSEAVTLCPDRGTTARSMPKVSASATTGSAPIRNASGLVVDHRDGWLSSIAYHAVWDWHESGRATDPGAIVSLVWDRFADSTDLSRPKQAGRANFGLIDAERKVRDKLTLLDTGRLPARQLPACEPVAVPSSLPLAEARDALSDVLTESCARIAAWHEADRSGSPPRIGIRASVGLGKTAVSRRHITALRERLRLQGLPHRVVVVTPSHRLAEEAAAGWREAGLSVAVHRGYEAIDPVSGQPMCRDLDMVRMAVSAGLSVFPNSCLRSGGSRCHAFETCLKQSNLREVAKADVVIAAYDALFSGLPVDAAELGVILIDEGCWARAIREMRGLHVETLAGVETALDPRLEDAAEEEALWEEQFRVRGVVARALAANGSGALRRQMIVDVGLTSEGCIRAAEVEARLRPEPGLRPGLPQGARKRAIEVAREARLSICRETLFRALARLLDSDAKADGRVLVHPPDRNGLSAIVVTERLELHAALAHVPILHLDATLRDPLASATLPGLKVCDIAADMPHQAVSLISGSFGKGSLCPDRQASEAENRRRINRLADCVDHVRWHAARVQPGRVLVVTYQAIEAAFANIAGVEVAHFNAVAGLDLYRDVALLIVVGRPLPAETALEPLVSAWFGRAPTGGYQRGRRGVLMRDGTRRAVQVLEHADPQAEVLRAAICDDEVIQAIGRGRGVNRTADLPLDVHILADLALPLIHDRVLPWDEVAPNIVQRMLLAGLAVDSPADACLLHPTLLANPEQAKKAFQRAGFGGHFPIDTPYREMSLKSARYRKGGRGQAWQSVYWLEGDAEAVRARLEQAVGPFQRWEPYSVEQASSQGNAR